MRSWGWRQGRGRRADTVYLKPKKKVPAPAAGQPSPPPANFSSSSAQCLPLGLTRVLPPSPRAWHTHLSQPRFQRGHWSGLAATHCPHGDRLSLPRLFSAGACGETPRSLQLPSPGCFTELEAQQEGRQPGASNFRVPSATKLVQQSLSKHLARRWTDWVSISADWLCGIGHAA